MAAGQKEIAEALGRIADNLWSPNEQDRNLESANVVDGLFAIARALRGLAEAVRAAKDAPPADGR